MWCDVREKPQQEKARMNEPGCHGIQNNNHPHEWEDNIVIEK